MSKDEQHNKSSKSVRIRQAFIFAFTTIFSGIGVFALQKIQEDLDARNKPVEEQKTAEEQQEELLQKASEMSLKVNLDTLSGDGDIGDADNYHEKPNEEENNEIEEEPSILGRFDKNEWENLKWRSDSISLTSNDECYDITFEEETPNPQIYVYESRSEGYINIPLLYNYFSSPNIVWMLTVCDEEGNQIGKYGIIGQMEDKQRVISNVPISVGNTYLIFDLIDENYIGELLQFKLHYSLGQFKMEDGT